MTIALKKILPRVWGTLLSLLMVLSAIPALALTVWQNTGAPVDGQVTTLAVDPSKGQNVYAGVSYPGGGGALLRSTDGGGTWSAVNPGLPALFVSALAVDSTVATTLYAGTSYGDNVGGVYKSLDGGHSWNPANNGLTDVNISSLAIDPSNPKVLYAGTPGSGVFRSVDGGASWSAINSGLEDLDVAVVAVDPSSGLNLFAATSSGVFKSTDGGDTWRSASSGLPRADVPALVIDRANPQVLYASSWNGGVFKSTDGAASWNLLPLPSKAVNALVIDPNSSQTIYASGFQGGVFKSVDGGGSWSAVNSGLKVSDLPCLAIDPTNSETLYAALGGGGISKGMSVREFPTIAGAPPQSAVAGSRYNFTPTTTSATSFTISGKPPWADFDAATGALTGTPADGDARSYPDIIISVTNSAGTASLPPFSLTVTQAPKLSVALGGSGAGTVTTLGIACIKGSAAGCAASFAYGSSVTLHASPDANSTFAGWGGECGGASGCTVSMTSDRSVTATFSAAPKAKIGSASYGTLASACAAAGNGATILAREVVFPEQVIFSGSGSVFMKGGFNAAFDATGRSFTVIDGCLKIRSGRLVMEKVEIR